MNFFTELKNRITLNSPLFFKKIQATGITLTLLSTALIGIPGIPDRVQEIAGYILTAGIVMTTVAKLTVKDPDYTVLDKPTSNE